MHRCFWTVPRSVELVPGRALASRWATGDSDDHVSVLILNMHVKEASVASFRSLICKVKSFADRFTNARIFMVGDWNLCALDEYNWNLTKKSWSTNAHSHACALSSLWPAMREIPQVNFTHGQNTSFSAALTAHI